MTDPRISEYSRVLVEWCLDVQEDWQVIVQTSPFSRPLYEEVVRAIARKGAYVIPKMNYNSAGSIWAREAPGRLLEEPSDIERFVADNADAWVTIVAPENTKELTDIDPDRMSRLMKGMQPLMKRRLQMEIPWVGCNFPTQALAQDSGMSLWQFEDFLYGACLLDWAAQTTEMKRLAERFDRAREVRVEAPGTDITVNLEGRSAVVDDGKANMPGGEFYFGPVEEGTAGVVTFSEFPALMLGNEIRGLRLEFEDGRVTDASADTGEAFLSQALAVDDGARTLGEFGVGCNAKIDRYMRNTLFDEKMGGTVHFALGASLPETGGTNESALHWDVVKDLRAGGRISCDGDVVQENGEWLA